MRKVLVISLAIFIAACMPSPPIRGVKISQLPAAASPITGAETMVIVQNGQTVRVSVADLRAYLNSSSALSAGTVELGSH